MNSWDALSSVLEVGIGIAGFSGIVVAFGRGQWSRCALHLLPSLLDISLVVLVLSFVPMILLSAGLSEALIWQCTSGLTALYLAVVLPYRSHRLKKLGIQRTGGGRVFGLSLNSAVLILSVLNMVWLRAAWPHLVALVVMLILAFGVFSYLVAEMWCDEDDYSRPGKTNLNR